MARDRNTDKVQMTGSEAELSRGPRDMRQSAFPGGMLEMTGSEAELSKSTTPMGEFDKHVRGGTVEMTGSEALVNRTPRRGRDSWDTPISDNTQNPDSTESGYPRSGRK